jgi:hypothetical protein
MPAITILPANLATLVLESCLYGILLLLFISTVYFLATRRTLAGHTQTRKHHFTSLVFLAVTFLFLVITGVRDLLNPLNNMLTWYLMQHWSAVIYQAFFAFLHLSGVTEEHGFYGDLSEPSEVAKVILMFIAIFVGDALIVSPHCGK